MALYPCIYLSVCLFITHRYYVKTAEQFELFFGTQATIDLSYIVLVWYCKV